MKSLTFCLVVCCLFASMSYADHHSSDQVTIIKTFEGVVHMPLKFDKNETFDIPTEISPRVIRDQKAFDEFASMIVKHQISKRRGPLPKSNDPLLKNPKFDFSKNMMLVAFYEETIYVHREFQELTKTDKGLTVKVVKPALGNTIMLSRPLGVGTYTAILIPAVAGDIHFEEIKMEETFEIRKPKAPKKGILSMRNKYKDYTHMVTMPTVYQADPPYVGKANPDFPLEVGTTFKIEHDAGAFIRVEFSTGEFGYLPSTSDAWAKLVDVTGKVVHKPWSKSMESWNAGGSDYCILDLSGEIKAVAIPGKYLRSSDVVSFDKIKGFDGRRVRIIGVADIPKRKVEKSAPGEISQRPIGQFPIGLDRKPVSSSGMGKGIKVFGIYPMKESRNATAPIEKEKIPTILPELEDK